MTGIRFARDFAQLCMLWLKYDREPDLSVTKLGVQIFTTPSISLELVQRYSFLTHLLAIEYTYFTTKGHIGRPVDVNTTLSFEGARDQPTEFSWKPDVKIMHIQEEIHHLLGNEAVRRMIPKQTNWLVQFLEFVTLFQGMHVQKRETGQHREYESRAGDVAYNITAPITRLMGYMADGYEHATREELREAFNTALSFTFNFCSGAERNRFPFSDPVNPVRFHVVRGVEVIEFNVAEEHVSLHYPLNWMLSLLVSKIVNFDRGSPTDWTWWIPSLSEAERHQTILTCVDYPLRAKVFCSQIRAKLWLRNGTVMYRQYNQYNGPRAYGRSCSDFTFLQWGFAILPAEEMLPVMLDRYDLLQLSALNEEHLDSHSIYGTASYKGMIQDFFQLFLHLINDRDTVIGESKENIVRREIAQRLIFKRLPYSEILRQVRYHTEVDIDDYFDKNLFEMAQFHPPTEAKSGLYELKTEYYSLVDPRHRSYTRNQAVECEKLLTDFLASKGVSEANRLVEPPARIVAPITGPFAGLTKVLGTQLFAVVACRGICFSLKNPSETIVDHITHLCLIAVMDQTTNRDFINHAKVSYTDASFHAPSLVQRFLDILNDHPEYTDLYPKIRRLLSKMRALDPISFNSVPRFDLAPSADEESQAAAEAEQKKTLARQRQLAALNKIKLAQSKFQEDNKALLAESDSDDDFETPDKMDVDDDTVTRPFQFPQGTCILCQEATNGDEPYGLPVTIHQSTLFRMTPLDNDTFIAEVARTPASLDTPHERPAGQANQLRTRHVIDSENQVKEVKEKVLGIGFPRQALHHCLTVTTCGHLVHDKCWASYFLSVKARSAITLQNHPESVQAGEFLCPLCRGLSNAIIPVVWGDGVNRAAGIPAWSGLSLQQLPLWLDEQMKSLLSCSVTQTIQNLDAKIVEVLPRLFPSLVVERRRAENHHPSLEYNKNHDQGRIKMYDELIQQARRRLLYYNPEQKMPTNWDSLCVLLAGTITSMEIAQRGTGEGIGAELYPPVLGAISSQNLTLLRVLAETVRTMMVFREDADIGRRIHRKYYWRMEQLIPLDEMHDGKDSCQPTILKTDLFERFVIACGVCSAAFGVSVDRLLLLHYIAEVTKIILAILGSAQALKFILTNAMWPVVLDGPPLGPRGFLRYLAAKLEREPSQKLMNGLYYLAQRFILPFLRKAVIFSHVYEGILFSKINDADEVEADLLCHLLGLPTLAEVLDMDITTNVLLSSMIQNWTSWQSGYYPGAVLELHHPAVFEVIGLPTRLDVLLELASKYHCSDCHQVPDEPAMCLFCGEIVCSQTRCCAQDGVGEMNLHRNTCNSLEDLTNNRCSRSIGVFLWLKRNSIVLLRQPPLEHSYVRGDIREAPYLNVHGESERDVR
jgi:E3 ubiquitin-protein ligase UBR1